MKCAAPWAFLKVKLSMADMPDTFTPWDGKRKFKGERLLQVWFRCGRASKDILPAQRWNGIWQDSDYDIIGVRPVE